MKARLAESSFANFLFGALTIPWRSAYDTSPHVRTRSEYPSMTRMLESIQSPSDLKQIAIDQLPRLAQEIREVIMSTVGTNGGHLAPNLGTVEICLAMNYVF